MELIEGRLSPWPGIESPGFREEFIVLYFMGSVKPRVVSDPNCSFEGIG